MCYCRRRSWWFTDSIDRHHTFEGLVRFFEDTGGIPGIGRTDRMGCLGRSRGRVFHWFPEALEFAAYHGFSFKACQARDAKRKGQGRAALLGDEGGVPAGGDRHRPTRQHR